MIDKGLVSFSLCCNCILLKSISEKYLKHIKNTAWLFKYECPCHGFGGKAGARDAAGMTGSVENPRSQALWKTRGAGVFEKHGVPGFMENTGCRGL